MRVIKMLPACAVMVALFLGPGAHRVQAEDFTLGAIGGIGFMRGVSGEGTNGTSARAGERTSPAAGFFFRDDMYPNISGEFRYIYRWGVNKVSNGSGSAKLAAHSQLFHYDLLFHTRPESAGTRPFIAVGVGGRIYQGTGTPPRTQALSNLVLLRKASEVRPMLSLGGGWRWSWHKNTVLQFDLRDYMTPAPRKVFAPSSTSTVSGWIHDLVPQISIGVKF